VLLAVNGTAVANQMDLTLLLNRSEPGDKITLAILRDGKKMEVPVKLGEGREPRRVALRLPLIFAGG